jgi:hypothetical protein
MRGQGVVAMRRSETRTILIVVAVLAAMLLTIAVASARGKNNPKPQPVIYVTSQDLYYDSIVTAPKLPPNGPFNLLYVGPNGLTTEWGPGDQEYYGGRWKMADGDGGFVYFECPLLGPGRDAP